MKIEKIYTDNPLLDELVYAAKIMMTDCILKDQELADSYETLESAKNADIYIAIIENTARYEYFDYTYEELLEADVPKNIIPQCIIDNKKVPEVYRDKLLKNKSKIFFDNYIEANEYYRTLNGIPNKGEKSIYIKEEDLENTSVISIDTSIPLHKQEYSDILVLENLGVLDKLMERYPNYKYIKFCGKRKISIYDARKASKFQALYVATPENVSLKNRFTELLELSRNYTMKTVYMEAYKFESENYDKFMIVFIILQAVIDFLAELPEYYIRRDIFDLRTIEYFFESSGVDYYSEIPLQYQISLVQNLNKLIKYSGTNKVIIEIASLFGFDNIQIFAYYMLKERLKDSDGNYLFHTKPDPDGNGEILDNYRNYDLKFIKVPLGESIDDYIKNENNHYDYSYLTGNDKYWNGEYSKDYIKKKILEYEFNIIKTKYISVDAVVELTDLSFQIPYFVNLIMFSNVNKDNLKISIPSISNDPILITDAFILLYALMYEYYGLEDAIIDTPTKYLTIKGFNFDVNMAELALYVKEKGFTLEELGVSHFKIPKSGVFTFNQLVEIYTTNKEICDHLIQQMKNANSKKIYDIYKYLYDALMFTNVSYDYYYIKELDRMASTYTEFLAYKDTTLYDYLDNIKAESDPNQKTSKITIAIGVITSTIHKYLDSENLKNIFANIPTQSIDYLKVYMFKVINFFKSYKIDLNSVSNIYKFSDKYENRIFVLDDVLIQHFYEWKELISMGEKTKFNVSFKKEDTFILEEICSIIEYINKNEYYNEKIEIVEKIRSFINTFNKRDYISIAEVYYKLITVNYLEIFNIVEQMTINSSFKKKDRIFIDELVSMKHYFLT